MNDTTEIYEKNRRKIYRVAILASIFCVLYFIYNLSESLLITPESSIKPWSQITLSERGDFLGGFFAPLGLIWAVVAVMLQQLSINLQRDEMRQQTSIFNAELKNIEKENFRSELINSQRIMQRHALMIREAIVLEYTRSNQIEYSENDVELTLKDLRKIDKEKLKELSESDKKNAIDRMCSYRSRFETFHKKSNDLDMFNEYKDFLHYTPYGHLFKSCNAKLKNFVEIECKSGKNWHYDGKWQRIEKTKQDNSAIKEAAE